MVKIRSNVQYDSTFDRVKGQTLTKVKNPRFDRTPLFILSSPSPPCFLFFSSPATVSPPPISGLHFFLHQAEQRPSHRTSKFRQTSVISR
ncbi:hypothetical protein Droror1_Dr00015021, partial [Drosera rotundifolia]